MVMKINLAFAQITEENHEKPQSDWSAPGFELGTSRIRVKFVTTAPFRSVQSAELLVLSQCRRNRQIVNVHAFSFP